MFLSAACVHAMSCVNTWLMSNCFGCLFCMWLVICFAGHVLVFLFCVSIILVSFILVFCVPCALMLIVLTPPILLPDYWLICPTCVYLVTLLICSLYNLLVFAVLCPFVIDVTMPRPACQAWLPAVLFFPLRGSFVCFIYFNTHKKPILHNTVLKMFFFIILMRIILYG